MFYVVSMGNKFINVEKYMLELKLPQNDRFNSMSEIKVI